MPDATPKPIFDRLQELRKEVDAIVRSAEYTRNRNAEWIKWVSVSSALYMAELYARSLPREAPKP